MAQRLRGGEKSKQEAIKTFLKTLHHTSNRRPGKPLKLDLLMGGGGSPETATIISPNCHVRDGTKVDGKQKQCFFTLQVKKQIQIHKVLMLKL